MALCNVLMCVFPCCIGHIRYMIAAMGFLSVIVSHCQRTVLNIAIVEMVGRQPLMTYTCPVLEFHQITNIGGGNVAWDEQQQNLVIASFYIGYVVMQVPSGMLCDKYGARYPLLGGFALSTIATCLIPLATMHSYWWLICLLRVVVGIAQSVQYPALSSLLRRWIPASERATIGAIVFASNSIGLIVGNLCTGLIIKHARDWTLAFYVWSVQGVLFVVAAYLYVYSDPRVHPHLTVMEKNYLDAIIVHHQRMKTPYCKIFFDPCVLGLLIGQIGHDLIMFTLANNLPKYLNNVIGYDIETNALFSFIYLFQMFSSYVFGKLADHLVSRNWNIAFLRKSYTVSSIVLSGMCLLGAGLARCDRPYVMTCFALATFWNGLYYCGMKIQILDISVNNTGFVMSVVNGWGAISGFFCSYIIGAIAKDNSHAQWNLVFGIMLAVDIVSSILYCIMTSCDRRKWDYLPDEEPPQKKPHHKWYLEMTHSEHQLLVTKQKLARSELQSSTVMAKMSGTILKGDQH